MKRVSIIHGPYDLKDEEFEVSFGYVEESNTLAIAGFYIQEGLAHVVRVTSTLRENVYVAVGNTVIVGETIRGDIALFEVHEMLKNMNGFEFFMRYVVSNSTDIDFKFAT